MRFVLDLAGVYRNYDFSDPSAMAFCVLLYSSTLITLALHGATACLVVITLDRYWKIVHAVHHRGYYRRWMIYVGLLLPWLNGVATHVLPAISTASITNGTCRIAAFETKVLNNFRVFNL